MWLIIKNDKNCSKISRSSSKIIIIHSLPFFRHETRYLFHFSNNISIILIAQKWLIIEQNTSIQYRMKFNQSKQRRFTNSLGRIIELKASDNRLRKIHPVSPRTPRWARLFFSPGLENTSAIKKPIYRRFAEIFTGFYTGWTASVASRKEKGRWYRRSTISSRVYSPLALSWEVKFALQSEIRFGKKWPAQYVRNLQC